MAQNVLVDLNLNDNSITNLADGAGAKDAVNKGQMDAADAAVTAAFTAADAALTVAFEDADSALGDAIIALDSNVIKDVVGTNGVSATPGLNGLVTLAAVADPLAGNTLTVGTAGLYVPAAAAASVSSVDGTLDRIAVGKVGSAHTVDIDPAYDTKVAGDISTAVSAEAALRISGDAALQAEIDDLADNTITGGDGINAVSVAGNTTISAKADPAAGNTLTVGAAGLFVPTPAAATVSGITSTPGETTVDNAGGTVFQVGLDDAITDELGALRTDLDTESTERAAEDVAIGDRIDAIVLTGTGMVSTVKTTGDNWTIDVPAIALANTYTGGGTDSGTINSDLAGRVPAIVPQPGDLYVNDVNGAAFLNTAPIVDPAGVWTELSSASVGIDSITGGDGSITVGNGAGPVADVMVSTALQDEIAASTATNGAQDTAIAALEAASHTAATGAQAISVNGAEQIVSLTIDGASTAGVVSQSTLGLKVDTSAYATNVSVDASQAAQDAKIAALESADHPAATAAGGNAIAVDVAQVVSLTLDTAATPELSQSATGLAVDLSAYATSASVAAADALKADKATTVTAGPGLNGGGTLASNFAVGVLLPVASGLSINAGGLFVDAGEAIERRSDGIAVKSGEGITTVNDAVEVDTDWLATFVENSSSNIVAGDGIDIAAGLPGNPDTISAKLSTDANNVLVIGVDDGLYVPTPPAADLSNHYTKAEADASQAAQNTVINSKVASVGVTAPITNTGTPTAPVIGIDVSALTGVAKVISGDVTVTSGIGTFANSLNNADVVVAIKQGDCYVTAGVCATAAGIDIEAADGTYRVIATGVQL